MNYIGFVEKDKMIEDRKKVNTELLKIFKSINYKIEINERYSLTQYYLRYTNTVGNFDKVKVEINYSERVPILGTVKKKYRHLFELPMSEVIVLKPEEIFGSKIITLFVRTTPRDLLDVWNLYKNPFLVNKDILRKMAIFFACAEEDFRKLNLNAIDSLEESEIKKRLNRNSEKMPVPDLYTLG
ncbi:MAG: nucleotidyl transferase AbiEii/AbiGii toxin family protein [Methanosarcinales archaeon]